MFPTYGFGAKLSNGQVSFCFNVNYTHDPNCAGVTGILEAYKKSMGMVQLWGPTNFAPVINQERLNLISGLVEQFSGTNVFYSR